MNYTFTWYNNSNEVHIEEIVYSAESHVFLLVVYNPLAMEEMLKNFNVPHKNAGPASFEIPEENMSMLMSVLLEHEKISETLFNEIQREMKPYSLLKRPGRNPDGGEMSR